MAATMTVDEVITKAFAHAKVKATPPATGTSKYNVLLAYADSLQKEWAAEPGVEWGSRFSAVDIGSVTATDTFALDSTIDYVTKDQDAPVYTTDGTNTIEYSMVEPALLRKYEDENVVSQQGTNLVFGKAFTSDSTDFGWDIYVPSYTNVSDITVGTETVEVDDPMWLGFMVAAEYVRNDLVRQNQYSNVLAHANLLMEKMKEKNKSQRMELTGGFEPLGVTWE